MDLGSFNNHRGPTTLRRGTVTKVVVENMVVAKAHTVLDSLDSDQLGRVESPRVKANRSMATRIDLPQDTKSQVRAKEGPPREHPKVASR